MLPPLARLNASNLATEAKRQREDGAYDERPLLGALSPLDYDVQEQILGALNNNDCEALIAICQVNKEFNEMCKNDELWMSFANDRGWLRAPQFLTRQPPISYRSFYKYLCFFSPVPSVRTRLGERGDVLVDAVRRNEVKSVRMLLAAGADVYSISNDDLVEACENGYAEIVRIFLASGANSLYVASDAYPLFMKGAINRGQAEIMRILLEAGADPNALDGKVLAHASERRSKEMVRILLEAGADPNALDGEVLAHASEEGYAEIVRIFLEAGADPNALDGEALTRASENGHAKVVRMLLAAGADQLDAALEWAEIEGHNEIVQILLNARAASGR
jgi:ankyrin repeat protein